MSEPEAGQRAFAYLLPEHAAQDEDQGLAHRRHSYVSNADSDDSVVSVFVYGWSSCRNNIRAFVFGKPWFERFWLLVIVLNCFVLALEDPTDKECVTDRCKFTNICDYVFTNLFVLEMAIKLLALGVYSRKDSYFRDGWNIMDSIIVVTGFLAFALEVFFKIEGPVLSSLRAFRLLRPLKAVQAFPAVQLLIAAIIGSLPQLMSVFLLYLFFLIVMGIVSVQLWRGLFGFRCVTNESLAAMVALGLKAGDEGFNLTMTDEERICYVNLWSGEPAEFHDFGGHLCEWGSTCYEYGGNPHFGKVSFDNIAVSSLTLFVALTLEGWTETMYHSIDATTIAASLFWIVLVVLGSFFILNLTIVIITEAFEGKQRTMREDIFKKIDKDGGGELDKEEVRSLLTKIGMELTDAMLDKMFGEMDLDGGGSISLDEFLVYCQENSAAMGRLITKKGGSASFLEDIKGLVRAACPCITFKPKDDEEEGAKKKEEKPRSYISAVLYEIVEPTGTATTMPLANKIFRCTVMCVIILNTITLALEWHDQDETLMDWLHLFNNIFTILFVTEMLMKLVGLGPYGYFIEEPSNNFDAIISVLSLIELLGVGENVSVFRTFRVLRVLRLSEQVPLLQRWLAILLSSMKSAALLTGLLALIVFIIALLGMQIFGGNFCHLDDGWDPDTPGLTAVELGTGRGCGGVPRSNYDTLSDSLLTSFQILTGEDWNVVMYNGMIAVGDAVSLYFVMFYTIGNYMMLNLFIAVLLSNRDLKAEQSQDSDKEDVKLEEVPTESSAQKTLATPLVADRKSPAPAPQKWYTEYLTREWSLFLLPPENPIRVGLLRVVEHTGFEIAVLVAILVSTACLALESPLRPLDHPQERNLHLVNIIMVWVFLGEAITKTVTYGFVLHPTSYLRSEGWNVLDFFIVCISLVSLIPGAENVAFLKLLRTLRPLRFINKSEGMKVVLQALVKSIKPLMNVIVISGMIWLIFAILGMQLFAGKFYRCSLHTYGDMEETDFPILTKADCLNTTLCLGEDGTPCRWQTFSSNFDNLGSAFLCLFEMASLEGWVTVMHLGTDAVSHDVAPRKDANPYYAWYFVIFIVFGSWFLMNLFISVLIDTYYDEKEKAGSGGSYLTSAQKKWVQHHKLMLSILSHTPDVDPEWEQRFGVSNQGPLNRFCQSTCLDMFIMACIVVNILLMATEHYPESDTWKDILRAADRVFLVIFLLEALLKIINFKKWYFKDAWNRFDFAIVCLSIVGFVMEVTLGAGVAVSVFRVMRLSRLLRMVKQAEGIKRILKTLLLSLPSMINVAGIVGLLFFIYAVLGVKLFARLDRDNPNNGLGPYANFENFYIATLLLVRMTTGEAWQSILDAARAQPPDCDEHLGNCGVEYIAGVYFCSFTLAGMYVLLNLFIAVILDSFSEAGSDEVCTEEYLQKVKACWQRRMHVITVPDFIQTSGIKQADLESFLQDIGPPLGFPRFMPLSQRPAFIDKLSIVPDPLTGVLTEGEMFPKLFKARYGEDLPDEISGQLEKDEQKLASPTKALQATAESILRIQAMVRGHLARRRMRKGDASNGGGAGPVQARSPANPLVMHKTPPFASDESLSILKRQYPMRPPPSLSGMTTSEAASTGPLLISKTDQAFGVKPIYLNAQNLAAGTRGPRSNLRQNSIFADGANVAESVRSRSQHNYTHAYESQHGVSPMALSSSRGHGHTTPLDNVTARSTTPTTPLQNSTTNVTPRALPPPKRGGSTLAQRAERQVAQKQRSGNDFITI